VSDERADGWRVEVEVDYDSDWSKNRMWRRGKGGVSTYARKEPKAHRERLATALRAEMSRVGAVARQDRLHVELLVFRQDHRGDSHNCIDLALDGVEDATGLNDKWYSVSCDWVWTRSHAPTIRVVVSQGPDLGTARCPDCLQALPRDSFAKLKSGPMGRAWICRACTRESKARARDRKKACARAACESAGSRD